MVSVEVGPVCSPPRRAPEIPHPRPAARPSRYVGPTVALVTLQVLQVVVLHALDPRFFWLDDSQAQFGPTSWWLGVSSSGGRPPLMAPELGSASNLVADLQYGVLDPLHWVLNDVAGRFDDLLVWAWVFPSACMAILGVGLLWLLLSYRVAVPLAMAAAVGVASSGFLLWYGSSWWPVLWSVAWVPWLWLGMSSRRWPGVLLTGLASWALLAAGNPYLLPFMAILVCGQLLEWRRDGGWRTGVLRPDRVARLVAGVGGAVIALPGLVSLLEVAPVMARKQPEPLIGNEGFGVPNLGDVLVGGMTLMGQTNAFFGDIGLVPALATLVFAVPAAALVDWRRAWAARGVPTALLVTVAAVAATQLPTTVGAFRYPFRYLVVVQVGLALLVVLGLTTAPSLTRRRTVLAAAVVGLQGLLAVFRAPLFSAWHLLGVVLTGAALAALLVLLGQDARRRLRGLAGVGVVLIAASSLLVGVGMMLAVQERADALAGRPDTSEGAWRALYEAEDMPTTVEEYRRGAAAAGEDTSVLVYRFGRDGGYAQGVYRGNGNLVAGMGTGFGSIAVGQTAYNMRWCHTFAGATCSPPRQLLAPAPGTGSTWVDLLSADTVLLSRDAPAELIDHFRSSWAEADGDDRWYTFRRDDGLPGRVTAVDGVRVDGSNFSVGAAYSGEAMDRYTVSTGTRDGQVVLRTAYWPGLRATLDGRELGVGSVEGAVVALTVPAGTTSGDLRLYFEPLGDRILVPALAVGGLIVVGAAAGAGLAQRRGRAHELPDTSR